MGVVRYYGPDCAALWYQLPLAVGAGFLSQETGLMRQCARGLLLQVSALKRRLAALRGQEI